MDGEADALAPGCGAWRADAQARERWHSYHLIGDVLRSDELASAGMHDEQFLQTLRGHLDAQPVVLAPQVLPRAGRRAASFVAARRWRASAAVAAGFVAVAGVVLMGGVDLGGETGPTLAAAPRSTTAGVTVATGQPSATAQAVAAATPAGEAAPRVIDGALIRDPALDRYLAAHRQYGGSIAQGLPGGVLQRATAVAPSR